MPYADIHEIPEAYNIYRQMAQAQQALEEAGYVEMPEQAYQDWLKSVKEEAEKSRQSVKQMQQNLWKKSNLK